MPTEWAAAFAGERVLVIGDLMLDEFIWGKVSRISPEAPVPVVNVTGESYYPGGAANVARNVREFTRNTAVIGLAGSDSQGRRLIGLLEEAGIDTSGVQISDAFPTIVKTRVIARNQQVVRIDRERTGFTGSSETTTNIERVIAKYDAIIVADYGKGFVTQPLADSLTAAARAYRKILTVDPHPHTSLSWRGVTAIKPNRAEAFLAAGLPPEDSAEALHEAAKRLLERWQSENLLITLGEQGMLLCTAGCPPHPIPARAQTVFDVSGAGDTAIAVLTLALAAGATPIEAAELANRASGIVVGKLGTATVTPAELFSNPSKPADS
jgi:D-beta-D-heptose 7-phosphate kinase/D-beta-D-heptose 1-phosphate adenosyltransferase